MCRYCQIAYILLAVALGVDCLCIHWTCLARVDVLGSVHIWQLPARLSTLMNREHAMLDRLGSAAIEMASSAAAIDAAS